MSDRIVHIQLELLMTNLTIAKAAAYRDARAVQVNWEIARGSQVLYRSPLIYN
jgi:hypothetical protein